MMSQLNKRKKGETFGSFKVCFVLNLLAFQVQRDFSEIRCSESYTQANFVFTAFL